MNPWQAFATIFASVFLLIFLGSTALTYMLPEIYRSTARVMVSDPAQWQLLQSSELLKDVSQRLNLPETLAGRYSQAKPLEETRVEVLLRRAAQVRAVRGTRLAEIQVESRSPAESAQWANEIAESSARLSVRGIQVVDRAVASQIPVRPNKALNLTLGAAVGAFLGIMAGGVGAKLAVGFDGKH